MKVIYTEYAKNTLKDRKIDKSLIESSLKSSDEIIKGRKNRNIAHKIIGSKLLRIVFEDNGKTYIIITAYYSKPQRYIKK
ncbi:DUF4258 domain-containing protein [Candidatus Pacearchaeota archaeon]|nr:DUF4258 domain-containing protein [Candidatus Pacearchaeota archaeon]